MPALWGVDERTGRWLDGPGYAPGSDEDKAHRAREAERWEQAVNCQDWINPVDGVRDVIALSLDWNLKVEVERERVKQAKRALRRTLPRWKARRELRRIRMGR